MGGRDGSERERGTEGSGRDEVQWEGERDIE